ncbi:hypothetical protein OIU84_024478 [Salix udensis]|uniref:Uncharacterized protein n=1 Tax=Salix udensis TaxID=889485 RepID=A0AAD6PAR5_9ROSI|nr:hypothetical protein OIU84_024478 [Salix udensis]
MMPYWMVDIARENKVSLIHFTVFCAAANVFLEHPERIVGDGQKRLGMASKPEWVDFPSSVAYRNDEFVGAFEGIYGENASGITDVERVSRIHTNYRKFAVWSCPYSLTFHHRPTFECKASN